MINDWPARSNVIINQFITFSKMNLKNSPPFILDILPDTMLHIKLIQSVHDELYLSNNEYFVIFIDNLNKKLKSCIELFKTNKVCFQSLPPRCRSISELLFNAFIFCRNECLKRARLVGEASLNCL